MRNTWKIAVAFTLVLGFQGALAYAQPLIAGNTSAFGGGPIYTSDFTLGTAAHFFVPTGATAGPADNGRGLAIGGTEVFYTELTGSNGFGPTDIIRVAPYNAGDGGADTRSLPNPRPGSGIQDLTFSNGDLYVLTGYDTQQPWVYTLNIVTGAVKTGPIMITQPGGTDQGVDGFAVLPNGNFLLNNGDTSCVYSEYSSADGHFIGNTINVPGGPGQCTGVDTDGTSLYFLTDFNSITRTDLDGNMTGFNYFSGGDELQIEDISLVHPVTIITETTPAALYVAIKNIDDVNTFFDIKAELFLRRDGSDSMIGSGIQRCVPTAGGPPGTNIQRNIPGTAVPVQIGLVDPQPLLNAGDVLFLRVSARVGTNDDDSRCGGHLTAIGLRFFYDSVGSPSQFGLTKAPSTVSEPEYLHSDGTTCTNALGESQPTLTLNRTLSSTAPVNTSPRCKEVGTIGSGTNPFLVFSDWFLPALQ
jgi:hypothetical protein